MRPARIRSSSGATCSPNAPRHRAVLEKAAWMAGWGAPPPAGRGRGIALVESFGSIVAEVAEVEVVDGRIKVHRVCAAVDCGDVVNPDTAAAQIEGGIVFGLSAALFNEITIRDGRVVQRNFHDHPMPKLADSPSVTVEFISSGAPLGGLGEPGVPPIAPAVANAVFAATGQRLRTLPLRSRSASSDWFPKRRSGAFRPACERRDFRGADSLPKRRSRRFSARFEA